MRVRDMTKYPVLSEGGEGVLYEYQDMILKWYKPCVNLEAKRRKIQLLMEKNLPEEVVRPMEEVLDRQKKFCGYVMKKVTGEEFRILSNKRFTSANHITVREILRMLIQIKTVLEKLHSLKIYAGDLNDRNILFDSQYNVYFIDCDSWTVGEERCEVAMDLFQDPMLSGNEFDEKTDMYAYCILAWKALTRVHPFGGTMDPDRSLRERMQKGISVIDRPDVKLPRSIRSWRNLSPELISAFQAVFENGVRQLGTELEELLADLKYCSRDEEYYDGRYMTCPLCDAHAKVLTRPVSHGVMEGLTLTALWKKEDVHTVLTPTTCIDRFGLVTDLKTGKKIPYVPGQKYFFLTDGTLVTEDSGRFVINGREKYVFEKRFKSSLAVDGDRICYLNKQGSLCEVTVLPQGNNIKKLCQCANTAFFAAADETYCVVNLYDCRLVVCVNGCHHELIHDGGILNYGIHHDPVSDSWLLVLEDYNGMFRTLIVSRTNILYDATQIRYSCPLHHLCLYHSVVFLPLDGRIRGYAYEKNAFKDFPCDIVDTDSKLIRRGRGFYIVNHDNLYRLE